MRRKHRLGALLALLFAVSAISLAAPSVSSSDPGDGRDDEVIHLIAKTVEDSGNEATEVGDQFSFSEDLYHDDEKVGIAGGTATIVRIDEDDREATLQFVVTVELPDGQITTQGLATFKENERAEFRLAITGGTERYRTAHGEVFVEETDDPDETRVKLVIIY